mmetsp:Transcript_59853/g.141599  ORF Transcript_59853/g.141599 Transcript_59853/m.141599 type:complete len:611 (-) Transcript_59853:827-2659(-)
MGASGSSAQGPVFGNQIVEDLSGVATYAREDPYWVELDNVQLSLPKGKAAEIELASKDWALRLARNTETTGNFNILLEHLISRLLRVASEPADNTLIQAALSTLFLVRIPAKHFVENLPLESLESLFGRDAAAPARKEGSSATLLDALLQALVAVVTSRTTPQGFVLHVECANLLLMLLSQSSTETGPNTHNLFLERMMTMEEQAQIIVRSLLLNYTEDNDVGEAPPTPSLLSSIGSAAASVFLLPWQLYEVAFPTLTQVGALGDRSLLLSLVLCSHHPSEQGQTNPFKVAISQLRDDITHYETSGVVSSDTAAHHRAETLDRSVPFSDLYEILANNMSEPRATLLLYMLVQNNQGFLDYVLSRTDVDTLMIPLLRKLYSAGGGHQDHVYMLLILVLIFTQDAAFCANLHIHILPAVPWFQERTLHNMSVGSLLVVIFVRTIQSHFQLKDVYMQTNCLAALANTAPHFRNLHSYAAQRIVVLFDLLQRRYISMTKKFPDAADPSVDEVAGGEDLTIYADFCRIVLEVINACLTYSLPRNPHIVYAILHKRELFGQLRHHQRFTDLIGNIDTTIIHFAAQLDLEQVPDRQRQRERRTQTVRERHRDTDRET